MQHSAGMQRGYAGAPPHQPQHVVPTQPQINFFAQFVERSGIKRAAPLSKLSGLKLGVDGCKIIDNINALIREFEKLAPLATAVPLCAYSELARFSSIIDSAKITPDYCFSGMGLTIQPKDKEKNKSHEHNAAILSLNGRQVEPHRLAKAAEDLGASLDEDGENYVFLYTKLYLQGVVTRAPYWSWAQLASYFSKSVKYIDYVYGCHEMLAFKGIDNLIVSIDETSYCYVEKADLLAKLTSMSRTPITEADLPFIVGATSSHKQLNDPCVPPMSVEEFLQRAVRDQNGVLNHPMKVSVQEGRMQRAASAIALCPVLTPQGDCQPLCYLNDPRAPYSKSTLKTLFGSPLPPLYYYMQMTGMLSPAVLSTVATKKIVDNAPVVDSAEFRAVAEFIIPLRTQIVYQLVQSLNNNSPMEITWVRRYNATGSREMPILQPPQIRLDEWETSSAQAVLPYFVDVLPMSQNATSQTVYGTTGQAFNAVLLKVLDLLGYFTHATQTNSTEVSGPSVYSTALEACKTPSLSEYAVLLIELIRTKTLTDKLLTTGPRPNSTMSQPNPMIFASRLLSIVPLRLATVWTGPVSADLCGFNGMARSLQRTLRSLTEVISVITFFEATQKGQRSFSPEAYARDLQPKLPFGIPLMCCSGIVIQYIMENPNVDMKTLEAVFPGCLNLEEDLGMLFYFWYYAGQILTILVEDDQQMVPTASLFRQANAILGRAAVQLLGPVYSFLTS